MNQNVERNTFKTASVSGGILLSLFFLLITFSTISLTFLVNGVGTLFAGFFAFIFLVRYDLSESRSNSAHVLTINY